MICGINKGGDSIQQLLVKFWDVKNGHATYIRTPNGRHIVIDLGVGEISMVNKPFSPLKFLKGVYQVEQLDLCIITHPHLDHINDIMNFDSIAPKSLLRPKNIPDDSLLSGASPSEIPKIKEYLRIHRNYSEPVSLDSSQNIRQPINWGGVIINTFIPENCSVSNLNNQSVVTVLEYDGVKIVIPGDNENASWNELFLSTDFRNKIKDADIYLASHHGRESGFHQDVLKTINPRLTIVSDAKFHEHSRIDWYRRYSSGLEVECGGKRDRRYTLSTYRDGAITVEVNKDNTYNKLNVRTQNR